MSQLALFLFGPPRIQREETAVEIDRRKALALLAYLAITQQPQSRESLAALFWPDYAQGQSSAYLRHSLWTLNNTLGKQILIVDRYTVALHPNAKLWVDVNEFQRQWTLCQTHGHAMHVVCAACATPLSTAVALYQGDFMAGFLLEESVDFEQWQRFQAEYLRHIQIVALERLVQLLSIEQGQLQPAISYAQRWLALDPLNEAAHQRLMELYTWSGQRSSALRQYQECVQILDRELGAPPEQETTKLYETIQQNKWIYPLHLAQANNDTVTISAPATIMLYASAADRPTDEPRYEIVQRNGEVLSHVEKSTPIHNLPAQVTSFVGREVELVQLGLRLRDPACRLLSLVGAGGIGKTRLALQAASSIRRTLASTDFSFGILDSNPTLPHASFKDGVYFVPLAGVNASEFLASAIATTIKFSLYSQRENPEQQLLGYLADKEMLLVLDNFEHLLAGAGLVAKLLQAAPNLKIMATSRERLNVQGEWLFEVTGLAYPGELQLDKAEEYSAVQLFAQGARRVNSSFALTTQEIPAVIRICNLVEGMPLALELAASWMRVLSASEVVGEIEQSLAILTTSLHDIPERHRSLLAVFEHSWERLTLLEREVFQRLSVFHAGFRRDAAYQVTDTGFPILLALIDKSLLRKDSAGRFQVHELLRQFAAERLAAKPAAETATRDLHCDYYLTFVHEQGDRLHRKMQRTAADEIILEMENVRAAWLWAVQTGKTATLDLALDSLGHFYEICGWFREGEELFAKAATRLQNRADNRESELLGKFLAWLGFFSQRLGQYDQARTLCQQGLALFQPFPLQSAMSFCLNNLADIARIQGNYAEAHQHLAQSIAISQATGAQRLLGRALNVLGIVCGAQGQYAESQRHFEDSLAIFEAHEDQLGLTKTLNNLGIIAYFSEDYGRAKELYRRSVAINLNLGNQYDAALALNNLGLTLHKLGDYAEAIRLHQESLVLQRKVGYQLGVGITLNGLGIVLHEIGNFQEAGACYQEALQHAKKIDAIPLSLAVLVGIAALHLHTGEVERAARLATLVADHPSSDQEARGRATHLLDQLKARITTERWATIRQSSTVDKFTELIADALKTPSYPY